MNPDAPNPTGLPDMLAGLRVEVCRYLAGSKRGLRMGQTVYVSPAMFDLIRHAEGDELRTLLEAIEVVTIPEPPSIYGPLPMITRPDPFEVDLVLRRFLYGL